MSWTSSSRPGPPAVIGGVDASHGQPRHRHSPGTAGTGSRRGSILATPLKKRQSKGCPTGLAASREGTEYRVSTGGASNFNASRHHPPMPRRPWRDFHRLSPDATKSATLPGRDRLKNLSWKVESTYENKSGRCAKRFASAAAGRVDSVQQSPAGPTCTRSPLFGCGTQRFPSEPLKAEGIEIPNFDRIVWQNDACQEFAARSNLRISALHHAPEKSVESAHRSRCWPTRCRDNPRSTQDLLIVCSKLPVGS